MKPHLLKIVLFAIIASTQVSCTNPFEGVFLAFKEPIEDARYTFKIRDYENHLLNNSTFEILGKDANLLVNTLNDPKISVSQEGDLSIALRNDISPSSDSIIEFSVFIKNDKKFTTYLKEFRLQNRSNYSTTVRLAHLEIVQEFSKGVYLNLSTNTQLKENSNILINSTIPENLTWTTIGNQESSEEVEFLCHYFFPNGKKFIPGSGSATRPYDSAGKALDYSFDLPTMIGGVYIQGISGIKECKSWNKPVRLALTVETDAKVTDLMHYDTFTGRVTHYEKREIKTDGTRKYLDIEISKPGFWYAGDIRALCREGATFSVISKYIDLDIQYLIRVKDAKTNSIIKTLYSDINWEKKIFINYLPQETEAYYVEAYNFSNYHGGNAKDPLWVSKVYNNCTTYGSEVMDLFKLDAPDYVEVGFKLICPNGTEFSDTYLPKEMQAQYSPVGQNNWKGLVTFTPDTRTITTYKLEINKSYDFRVSTDGGVTWPYKQNDYLIKNKRWTFVISAENYCN